MPTAGEWSASIAHGLNQPLGAILNNTETGKIILNSPSLNLDEIKTILDQIRHDDQRATEVIRRLRRLLRRLHSRRRISISIKQSARCLNFFRCWLLSAMSRGTAGWLRSHYA
jgi:signal transduction histidine kinase